MNDEVLWFRRKFTAKEFQCFLNHPRGTPAPSNVNGCYHIFLRVKDEHRNTVCYGYNEEHPLLTGGESITLIEASWLEDSSHCFAMTLLCDCEFIKLDTQCIEESAPVLNDSRRIVSNAKTQVESKRLGAHSADSRAEAEYDARVLGKLRGAYYLEFVHEST